MRLERRDMLSGDFGESYETDEALGQLLSETKSVAASSLVTISRHGPLVTTGVVSTGIAAGVIYHKKRRQQSRLEDDHYAVRFDARLYPELFA